MRWMAGLALAVFLAPAAFGQARVGEVRPAAPVVVLPPPVIHVPAPSMIPMVPSPNTMLNPLPQPAPFPVQVVRPAPPVEPARDGGGGDAGCSWSDVQSIDGLSGSISGNQATLTISATTFGSWTAWRLDGAPSLAGEQNYRLRVCATSTGATGPQSLSQTATVYIDPSAARVRVLSATNHWWMSR